ncbi:Poly [ADP-ribose] polymerase 1 [Orchesella cincta]|uniref:Poly [ADP-ribose] polymerase 1 n=1 Tax=Orchesella cincta TaxID=48709 RepID=A0A1D2M3K0_ORCCI|nr:Poly [ADP-ribose] polymerase 1 [Orchesella cincta]
MCSFTRKGLRVSTWFSALVFRGQRTRWFNTVKGTGKYVPCMGDSIADDSVIVPCGKTMQNQKFQSYKLDFNEYIAFDAKRVQVKYAVDLEIIL